jgi:hypothetical protein
MGKIIEFKSISNIEALYSEIVENTPAHVLESGLIDDLLSETQVQVFLLNKLVSAEIDDINIVCYLIEELEQADFFAETCKSIIQKTDKEYEIRLRVYEMTKRLKLKSLKEPKVMTKITGDNATKKRFLIEMLDSINDQEERAAAIVLQLQEHPLSTLLSMIDYIGNYDDDRKIHLLKYLALSEIEEVQLQSVYYLGNKKNEYSYSFLEEMFISNVRDDIREKILIALQKIFYSREISIF